MKVVLLVLSGDPKPAIDKLGQKYSNASFETLSRAELEGGGFVARLSRLRAREPDIFAIATERVHWQRGQNALLLFGAMAGAQRTIIFDVQGGWREESRARSLTSSVARLLSEAAVTRKGMAHAARELRRLESAIAKRQYGPPSNKKNRGPLNITYLRTTPGPGTQLGGAASHIKGFVNAAEELGASISMISNDEIAGLSSNKTIKIIRPQALGTSRAAFEVLNNTLFSEVATAEIETQQPDFIYQRYSRFSWAGVEASLTTGQPLFLEYNGSEVWVGRHWDRVGKLDLLQQYETLNLTAARRIFVVSEVERRNLERAGVPAEKIVVNPNGVDTDKFQPGVGGKEAREKLGVNSDETLVGFVGSFGPWHGVEVLAEAIKRIPAPARIRFLLVGTGTLLARVKEALAEEIGSGRVILTGNIAHEEVPSLLDACDVLASPHVPLADGSEFFGSPTKVFEYMAMGKGIVASRLGQIGDVLTHEETALLVKPGDAEELSAAIQQLASSKALREELGANARRAAIERYTWKRNAQTVLDEYQKWLQGSN